MVKPMENIREKSIENILNVLSKLQQDINVIN